MSKPAPTELDELVLAYQEAGRKWVSAKLAADQLEEMQNSFLASLQNEQDNGDRSETEIKRLALADPRYSDYVSNVCHARAAMLALKVRYDALGMFFDALRTKEATNRALVAKGLFERGNG